MKLFFKCPNDGAIFETDNYSLVENRGVITSLQGHKTLQGTVAVHSSCPHCGELHRYAVEEVLCSLKGENNG
ncbi:MAG: hypothetical protein V2B20_20895 [Pseudomonadota bacterium]